MTSLQPSLLDKQGGQWSNSFHFPARVPQDYGLFNGNGFTLDDTVSLWPYANCEQRGVEEVV